MGNTTSATSAAWNGGICFNCGSRYLGSHSCTHGDILRRIRELMEQLERHGPAPVSDRTSGCPCRPENGGSGICGCILSGPRVTC